MMSSYSIGLMHQLVVLLLEPVIWGLLALTALAVVELGMLPAERYKGIPRFIKQKNAESLEVIAIKRIERSDFIARIAPMLGLMGTLIPLGPGLSALGNGELDILTTAMSVAFDTTVLGLLVGVVGFVIGRLRRRWYDQALTQLEARS